MVKSKKPIITINPREPLTKKARAGIETYALHRCGDLLLASLLIKFTLQGERMKREKLYQWLTDHSYSWNGVYWSKKGGE